MNHLSLFSGSGIGTLAAASVGIRTVAHAENDPACCYCLERLWPDARLFRDVRDVTAESVADLGPIDIISGGFPCQDVSIVGKGAGLGTKQEPTRSGLWFEFARIIREVRPAWLLIENVPALRVRGGDQVCEDVESVGYTWWAVVVGADDVGAPTRRKRVWIMAQSSSVEHPDSGQRQAGKVASTSPDLRVAGGAAVAEVPMLSGVSLPGPRQSRMGMRMSRPGGTGRKGDRPVWPSPIGYAQAAWEPERILEFDDSGMAGSVSKRGNEALLRMVGNAWCYENAVLMFRAIINQRWPVTTV